MALLNNMNKNFLLDFIPLHDDFWYSWERPHNEQRQNSSYVKYDKRYKKISFILYRFHIQRFLLYLHSIILNIYYECIGPVYII